MTSRPLKPTLKALAASCALPFVTLGAALADEPARQITFPDKPVGIFSYQSGDKRCAFRGQGTLQIPAGATKRALRVASMRPDGPNTSAKPAGGDANDDGKFLEKLKPDDLYKLDCGDGAVSEEFLRRIKALTGLQSLDLSGNRISGQTLSILEGMPNLKELSLAQDQIGDKDLKSLKTLTKLTTLDLGQTEITDAGLNTLKNLPLTSLNLKKTAVTDKCASTLSAMPALDSLDLSGTHVTDKLLKDLKNKNLKNLDLSDDAKITEACLADILAMKTLKTLRLTGTHISQASAEKIKKQLACRVDYKAPGEQDSGALR